MLLVQKYVESTCIIELGVVYFQGLMTILVEALYFAKLLSTWLHVGHGRKQKDAKYWVMCK